MEPNFVWLHTRAGHAAQLAANPRGKEYMDRVEDEKIYLKRPSLHLASGIWPAAIRCCTLVAPSGQLFVAIRCYSLLYVAIGRYTLLYVAIRRAISALPAPAYIEVATLSSLRAEPK